MKQASPPDGSALLAFIAESLQRHLEHDSSLQAASAGLRRSGLSVVIRVELTTGDAGLKVLVQPRTAAMPQWSSEDQDILRSLGIAGEADDTRQRSAKPGWR